MRVRWTEEEIKLLLGYYKKMHSGEMHKNHPLVIEASNAIRNLPCNVKYSKHSEIFRNPNGVALKLANFLYLDPQYPGVGMKGCSELDRIIFNQMSSSSFKTIIIEFLSALKNLGAKGIWLNTDESKGAAEVNTTIEALRKEVIVLESLDWKDIYEFLKSPDRKVQHDRITNETKIKVNINIKIIKL